MSAHILPTRVYYTIYAILMVCTGLTVWIAVFKATLVVLFFMHVKYSTRLTWAVVLGSVFWFGILITLTMSDYLTRAWRTFG
jgi:cytochrome c oxidase subunit 4